MNKGRCFAWGLTIVVMLSAIFAEARHVFAQPAHTAGPALVEQLNGEDKAAAYRAELALWDLREEAIPALVEDLKARAAAGKPTYADERLLAEIGLDCERPLLAVLNDGGPTMRAAARVLARLGNVQAKNFFRARLDDPDMNVRLEAVSEIGQARVSAEMDKLEELLKTDPEKEIRRAAARAISRIGGPRAVKLLAEEATNEKSEIRKEAAEFLSFIDPETALPIILDLVSEPSARASLIRALRDMADPRAVPVLIQLLNRPDGLVRKPAAETLARIGDRRAISPLIRTLAEEERGDFHWSVAPALRRLTGRDFGYFHGAPERIHRHALSRWRSWLRHGWPDWPQEKPPAQEVSAAVETLLRWMILGEPLAGAPEDAQILPGLKGLSEEKTIVLFGDNLPLGLDISLPGKEVLVLSQQQAQERAGREGEYPGIKLGQPRLAYGFAEISLDAIYIGPPWGRSWGSSGGTILLRKEDGKWRFHAWEGGYIA